MITIGYSTRKHNQDYIDYIQKTSMYKEVEVIEKVNNGEKSLSQVYNEILSESKNDIVVLCHDDLEFDTKNWADKIIKHFNRNPEHGILGLAGTKYLSQTAKWWEVQNTMYGIVNHKHEGKKWASNYSKDLGNKLEDVIIVDGLFIAINKKKIKHNFDESIEGFHFYDLGFCLPNFLDDVKIGVMFDVRVTHLSIGQTNQQWEDNRIKFADSYISNLPIDINNKELSETFIFVHDQDIVLEFESSNKLSNLYNYKYVFLGNRPTDKIENLSNLIIARNYEDNIEQYPLFTSYTGWYCLWKNNLIKTKYVNLFEYDTILNGNIDQFHTKFYENDIEMIGYVPFPVRSYEFVLNPNWNESVIPAIKEIHKFDLVEHYNKIVQSSPDSVWSSTSNTTFRKDIFDDYMKWFSPVANKIKDTKTCGHAHERSITYYSYHRKRKFVITKGLLQHLQLDSHKTQGHAVNLESSYDKLFNNKL